MAGLILPGNNADIGKMAKEAGAPPPVSQPQQIPLDQIIVDISLQVAQRVFATLIGPYEDRIKQLEEQLRLTEKEGDTNESNPS